MPDEIEQKLRQLEAARAEMRTRLDETNNVLDSIYEKIHELTDRQEARLRADGRIDNKVVDQMSGARKQSADERTHKRLDNANQAAAAAAVAASQATAPAKEVPIKPKSDEK